ncbi:MAG: FN3 domain-containing metallophosphoesterase family protein [Acidobacteriota bacterium]|nr:FN3 domain-containing metallophosphoesterase family protein [Acidobacteriota bacterium]
MSRPQLPLTCLIAFSFLFLAASPAAFPQSAPPVITHGPILTNAAPDGVTILWFTDTPCTSWVEYATGGNFRTFPSFGGLIQTARPGSHGLIDANTLRHELRLTGLEPGKAYRYRVVSKSILTFQPYEVVYGATVSSEIREFRTLDPEKEAFGFVVFQDLHNNAARLEALATRAIAAAADLVFLNGDNVSDAGREEDVFSGLFDTAARLFAGTAPAVLVRGNHETRGAMARRLESFFPAPAGRFYYAFSHGPVRFVILDSGEDKPDDSPVYAGLADFDRYRAEQAAWLEAEIESPEFKRAAFRIVFTHIPPFGKGYVTEQLASLWLPILNKGGVDLLLGGHFHTLYKIAPRSVKNDFPILGAPPETAVKASVSKSAVSLQVVDANGDIKDSLMVEAKRGRK